MSEIGACHYCGAFVGLGAHQHREERREPEVDSYTKSAEIAGKLLKHMEEAGCNVPSVTLFADGSGHLTSYLKDEVVAREVLGLYLSEVKLYSQSSAIKGDVNFNFTSGMLESYISVCHTCKRPLEEEK